MIKVNFHLKEDVGIEEEEITISIISKSKERSQSVSAKRLDDLTAVEQQTIKSLKSIIEKYRGEPAGTIELKYGL